MNITMRTMGPYGCSGTVLPSKIPGPMPILGWGRGEQYKYLMNLSGHQEAGLKIFEEFCRIYGLGN